MHPFCKKKNQYPLVVHILATRCQTISICKSIYRARIKKVHDVISLKQCMKTHTAHCDSDDISSKWIINNTNNWKANQDNHSILTT